MNAADLVFAGLAAMTLLGAFIAVWPKNVFHNALGLILALFGVAALFIFLNAEFLAVIQIIIYIGAISIAIIFAIMLSRPWFHQMTKREPAKLIRAFVASGALFAGTWMLLKRTAWPAAATDGDYSMAGIGRSLLTTYALPFEAVSLVLLVAIIGALVISGSKENA